MKSIHKLPAELVTEVGSYLSGKDLVAFMQVDSKLHDTLKINILNKLALEPINGGSSLNWAAANGCESQVRAVIKLIKYSASISPKDYNAKIQKAFDIAVQAYYDEYEWIVELLLKEGAKLDIPGENGQFPVHIAAITDSVEVLGVLVRHGADINAVDNFGNTPLYYAFESQDEKIARVLLRGGANTTITNHVGDTLLHCMARRTDGGGQELAQELIRNGANVKARGVSGRTPLHGAVISYNGQRHTKTMVEVLLEGGADINIGDNYGLTPLHCAVHFGNEPAVELLLNLHAAIDVEDERGETVLGWAGDQDHPSFSLNFYISKLILGQYNVSGVQDSGRDWMKILGYVSPFCYFILFICVVAAFECKMISRHCMY